MTSPVYSLSPERLWHYFACVSGIPRCSGNERNVARFVRDSAVRLGHKATIDKAGNVLVRKKAHVGREAAAMVALQSHLDMVCEKNSAVSHDFSRDPIVLQRDGNVLRACGTTLGADNGIGVATCCAIMEDRTVQHGPLEFLFTVDEETGLNGAQQLESGLLKSSILLNLDSEDEGVVCIGCAGGGDTSGTVDVAYEPLPPRHTVMKLMVRGLCGGHSGLEINSGRANAIKLLNRALMMLGFLGIRLCSIHGGNKRNAIPREADAIVAVPDRAIEKVSTAVREFDMAIKREFGTTDPDMQVAIAPMPRKKRSVLKRYHERKVMRLLCAMPHGVLAMSQEIPGLVQTSTNCATVRTTGKKVIVETSQRSSKESEKEDAMTMVRSLFELAGATVRQGSGYPGWQPDMASPVLKIARQAYKQLFNREVEVKAVHAGLECGIIGRKYPGLEMLSLGPTLQMVHSPQERVLIDTVEKYWKFLVSILEMV